MRSRGRGRGVAAPGTVLIALLLASSSCALALNPALDVSQYAHTAWRIRDGFTRGVIYSIAQTPDGYLWLGTEFGLLRFDGVRNVPWQPPPDQALPSSHISKLLAARDGTLWIGAIKGLASWKDGKLTQHPELAGQAIGALLEDREKTIWAGGMSTSNGRLCAIQANATRCYGEDGGFGGQILSLYNDRAGNLWVGTATGLWRWNPGPPKRYPMPDSALVYAVSGGENGQLLLATRAGIRRFANGKVEPYPLPGPGQQFFPYRLIRDRNGGLWIGTADRGLVHVHQGRVDRFEQSGGLSGNSIESLFEDREGNVWVSTDGGLDRFRDFAVATISSNQGLSNDIVSSVIAARDNSVWVGTRDGLNRWSEGHITIYRKAGNHAPSDGSGGLPSQGLESMFQDDRERIWIATTRGLARLENGRFISVSDKPEGENVYSIAGDHAGNLWISGDHTLTHLLEGSVVERIPWSKLGRDYAAAAVVVDPVRGGLWLGFRDGLSYFKDGQVRTSYAKTNGLGEGRVTRLQFDEDGTLWAATEGGLSRIKDGRVATLTSKNGLPCDAVHWTVQDDEHSFWLYMACGLVRIASPEMDAWVADPSHTIKTAVFDSSDGVNVHAYAAGYSPQAGKSPDGKLWFATQDGVSVIDPRHLPFNKLAPPVHIEQITADRKTYDTNSGVRLPPLVRDLQIDYTALSFVAPEKVRFRYKLEGFDRDWQDVGNRRQAFYTNLPPRNYRFRVAASNNSGVWNEAGASFDFAVAPAYYQTTWFRLSCVAAFLALLAALYQLRLRYLKQQFSMRLEERVNERTRIARDFHDTLLQSFHGVLMKFHAVTYQLPDRPEEARQTLESVIEQARQAVTEGRNAVQGLRSSTVLTNDLVSAITALEKELAAGAGENCPEFRVQVEGESRDLAPLVRDEVHRIASEAVRNAFLHAEAKGIDVEIQYGDRQFRLRVRDNGKGIDAKVLAEGRRAGHHGLPGMQERAKLAGGKLSVLSRPESGTEVELTIPGSFAYVKSGGAGRSMSSGKGAL